MLDYNFSYTNVFLKWRQRCVKNCLKNPGFVLFCLFVCLFVSFFLSLLGCLFVCWCVCLFAVKKPKISCSLDHTILFKFHYQMPQTFLKECRPIERLWTFNVSISNGSWEEFQRQIYCKNWFSDRVFYVTIVDADIWSLKSLHTLFNKCLDHMLVKYTCMNNNALLHFFCVFGYDFKGKVIESNTK